MATQGGLIVFKSDSGAGVTVISEATLNKIKPKPKFRLVNTKLITPGGQLRCVGQVVPRSNIHNRALRYRVMLQKL